MTLVLIPQGLGRGNQGVLLDAHDPPGHDRSMVTARHKHERFHQRYFQTRLELIGDMSDEDLDLSRPSSSPQSSLIVSATMRGFPPLASDRSHCC